MGTGSIGDHDVGRMWALSEKFGFQGLGDDWVWQAYTRKAVEEGGDMTVLQGNDFARGVSIQCGIVAVQQTLCMRCQKLYEHKA